MTNKVLLLKQKKRLIALAMITPMLVTSLTGCSRFKYEKQENGIVAVTGKISYDTLKKIKFVHIVNEKAKFDEYFVVIPVEHTDYRGVGTNTFLYKDIETNIVVYDERDDLYNNFKFEILSEHVIDYLFKYNMIKEEYNLDDLLILKDYLLADEILLPSLQRNNFSLKKKKKL